MCLFSTTSRQELLAVDKYVGRGFGRLSASPEVAVYFDELGVTRRVGDAFSRKLEFSDLQLAGEDPEDRRRPLEEFPFKFDGRHLRKVYGGPVCRAESCVGELDNGERRCLGCEETLDKCTCEAY